MAYTTKQELIDRFDAGELIQLTDRGELPAGVIDTDVLDQAIADAGAEIDGYLRAAGHSLPLASTPPIVSRLAADMTRYYLYDNAAPDEIKTRYERAVDLLAGIAAGRVSLGLEEKAGSAGAPESSAPDRVFTRDDLADY